MTLRNTSAKFKRLLFVASLSLSVTACSTTDHPLLPDDGIKEYHQTAQTKFITIAGSQIAYRELGESLTIPLIMIASLGSSMDDWDPAITNGLAQKNKVILVDIQGVASSQGSTPTSIDEMAKNVVAFTKALGYSKANYLGFSMGSFITQQIALTNPALVNKMILTGTGPKGAEGLANLPNLLAEIGGLKPEESFLKVGFTNSVASIAAGKAAYQRTQLRVVNRDKPLSQESSLAEVTAVLGWAQSNPNALKELENVQQPTLIIQGDQDVAVPVVNARRMAEHFPNVKLVVLPDAGHAALFQNPGQSVSLALDFLAK
jgi:pimeloyl-ACP methyl ester carboxylesterase